MGGVLAQRCVVQNLGSLVGIEVEHAWALSNPEWGMWYEDPSPMAFYTE